MPVNQVFELICDRCQEKRYSADHHCQEDIGKQYFCMPCKLIMAGVKPHGYLCYTCDFCNETYEVGSIVFNTKTNKQRCWKWQDPGATRSADADQHQV